MPIARDYWFLIKKLVKFWAAAPKKPRGQEKVVILIDWENLLQSMGPRIEKELSVSEIFFK